MANRSGLCISGPMSGKQCISAKERLIFVIREPIRLRMDIAPAEYSPVESVSEFHYDYVPYFTDGQEIGFWVPVEIPKEKRAKWLLMQLCNAYTAMAGADDLA